MKAWSQRRAKKSPSLPRAVVVSKASPRVRRLRQSPARLAAERRADTAADRALRGDRNIAADLGIAPSARANVAGSVGASLASGLRAAFERAFGADLAAVRVHTDGAAAAAARAAGARAFTAGRDIFFDLASQDLHGERGKWLLAHELAHVLQQTARHAADGRLRATDQPGGEAVQYKKDDKGADEILDHIEQFQLFAPASIGYAEIKKAYADVPNIEIYARSIEAIVGGKLTDATAITREERKALASGVTGVVSTVPELVLAYLVDVLKWAGEYKTANKILLEHEQLPTAFRSRGFYSFVRARSLAWIADQAKADATCKTYYPHAFIKSYADFFFSPGADQEPGKASKQTVDDINTRLNTIQGIAGRSENELTIAALFTTSLAEMYRQRALAALVEHYDQAHAYMVDTYLDVADRFTRGKATDDDLAGSASLEVKALLAAVFPEIQKHATKAAALWKRMQDFFLAQEGGKPFVDLTAEEVDALAKAIKSDKRFAKFAPTLTAVAHSILARPGGEAPSVAKFAAAVTKQRGVLAELIAKYVGELETLAAKDADETPQALQLGVAIYYLYRVKYQLDRYDRSADERLATSGDHLADVRLATQIRLVQSLNGIQHRFGFTELEQETKQFIEAGPHLALLVEWVPDDKMNTGAIQKDALSTDIREHITGYKTIGITPQILANFVYAAYYDQLGDQLALATAMRGSDYTIPSSKLAILEEARQNVKDAPRAKRYLMKKWEFSDPSDATFASTSTTKQAAKTPVSFGAVVFKHKRTDNALAKYQTSNDLVLTYASRPKLAAPFPLWIVPRMDELVQQIATDKLVKQVTDWWAIAHKGELVPDPKTEWRRWLHALEEMAASLKDPAAVKRIVEASSGAAQKDYERARDYAFEQGRHATTHDRRMMVDETIAPLWSQFDRNDPRTFEHASKALTQMWHFMMLVFPSTDRAIQMTALMVELAPDLHRAIGKKSRLFGKGPIAANVRVVGELMPLASGALNTFYQNRKHVLSIKRDDLAVKDYMSRVRTLDVLVEQMRESVISSQEELGFSVDAKKQRVREIHLGGTVDTGKPFHDIYGTMYTVSQIHQSFTFHPAHAGFIEWDINFPGRKKGSGEPQLLDEYGKDLPLDGRPLLQFMRMDKGADAKIVEVTATKDDFGKLHELSMALGDAAGLAIIAAVGVLLEKVTEIVLDVLEFLPGVGQAIMATRFVVAMLDFLTSDEFSTVMDALSDKGLMVFPELFDQIRQLLKPADLLSVLLFNADFAMKPPQKATPPAPTEKAAKSGAWQKIGRAISNIFLIGKRMWTRLTRLVKWVQYPFRAAQMWVLEHPGVALLLDFVVAYYDQMQDLVLSVVMKAEGTEQDEKEAGPTFKQVITDALDSIVGRAQGMVEELGNLEVPGTLIEVSTIVDWMIDMVVMGLSAKYRKGMQAVRYALDKLGLWSRITGAIGAGFKSIGADPNKYWKDAVKPPIQEKFGSVRDELVGGLVGQLNKIPFLDKKITEPNKNPIKIEFDDSDEFDDAEKYPAEEDHATASAGAMPTVAGGEELPPEMRAKAERGLGHNFGHVRLHRGADAERVTARLGAEGVTTGSHVYLRPGLSPDSGFGREVLHHELAHVIQQTGPRPLGGEHSDQPASGSPGRGVAFDPARESAADRAASRAASSTHASAPADVGGRSAGLQPFIGDEFLTKFLAGLTRGKGLALAEKMAERKQQLGAASLHADANAVAIHSALKTALLPALIASTTTYRAPFDKARPEIVTLLSGRKAKIEQVLPAIMEIAALVVSGKKPADKPAPEVWYLAPRRLALALERYLFAAVGIGFNIDLQEKTKRELVGAKPRPVLDLTKPIKSVTVSYLHLPMIEEQDAAPLWNLIVKNTNPAGYSAAKHDLFVAVAKLIVARYGPRPDLYDSAASTLQFTTRFSGSMASLAKRIAPFLKATYIWPSPADYADPKGTGSVGLRYGPYKVWSKKGEDEREAHHITQFLLVEYFSNHNAKKPFPLAGDEKNLYPGLLPVDSAAINSMTDAKGKTIEVGKWHKADGGAMPTIFLSTYTHQSGIHYRRSQPDESTAKNRSSQGWTVANVFREHMKLKLGADAGVLLGQDKTALKALQDLRAVSDDNLQPAGMKVTRNRFRDAVYSAARYAYQDMVSDMYPKLSTALHEHEVRYYNAIAEQKQMPDRMKSADTTNALSAAQTGNKNDFGIPSGFGS